MTVSVQGSAGQTVVFQTRKVKGSDLETDRALLDLDDIPVPAAINTAKGYTTFTEFYNDLPDNTDIQGPVGPQGPAIDTVSLSQSVDLSTVTMSFTYQKNGLTYAVASTPTFTIPAGPVGPQGVQGNPGTNGTNGVDGTDGDDGSDGISVTDVNQVNSTTINFDLSNGTTTSNITLPTQTATDILPSYTNNAGKVLAVNSTTNDIEWIAAGTGTVTSVGITGSNGISVTGSPVTTSGSIALSVNAATLKSHLAITFADVGSTPTTIAGYGITDAFDGAFASLTSKPTTIAGYGITDAFSGAYSDLSGKPTIPTTVDSLTNVTVTTVADNELLAYDTTTSEWINQTPAEAGFATVATSGAFTDLSSTPTTIAGYGITDAFDGAFSSLTSTPTTIAGYGITDAFSGAYADLTGKPTIPSTVSTLTDVTITTVADNELLAYDNATSEWINQTPAEAGFATVATSGSFSDLSSTPTTIAGYGITDAFSGAYADLTGKPTIPASGVDFDPVGTDNSTNVTLNNTTYDYLTISGQAITVGQVDWSTDISNRPTIPTSGVDFDPVGTDNSTNVSLATVSNNYLSLSGQEITAGTIPYQLGGTGLTTLGSAGQVLKVNSAGTALEYATDNTGAGGGVDPVVMALALG